MVAHRDWVCCKHLPSTFAPNSMPHTLSVIALVALCAFAQALADVPTVATQQGTFRGIIEDDVVTFRGIAFAQPPVDELRWQPPKAVRTHKGIQTAQRFASRCVQSRGNSSEDCLYLNVWTPALDSAKRPVLVWIHGGGFRSGSGEVDGGVFVRQDAVVVSFNYRLGPLGFFAHEAIPGKDANFGLLDMVEALKWVRTNIASFGGDPGNVTIFGVSAGGMAVNLLMVTKQADGLFQRAIAQSGYGTWPLPRSRHANEPAPLSSDSTSVPTAEAISAALIKRVTQAQQTEQHLLSLDAAELAGALEGFQLPIVDAQTLDNEPGILFRNGRQHDVPFMTGGNSNEGTVMGGSGIGVEAFAASFHGDIKLAKQLYHEDFARNEAAGWQRIFGDNRYLLSAYQLGGGMRQVHSSTWLYYVDFVPAANVDQWIGTPHGMDGYFLWQGHTSDDAQVQQVASRLQTYWLNFARSGNPNSEDLMTWPAYNPDKPRWLVVGATDSIVEDVLGDKLALLSARYERRIGR